MASLDDYRGIVGDEIIGKIFKAATPLLGKRVIHLNSTYQGGGVAEILTSLIPLMNDVGIDVDWKILHGTLDFFTITKKFHNALHGEELNLSEIKKRVYMECNERFSVYTHIDHDCVIVHDPQPLPLVKFFRKKQPWIWRCHVDMSNPNPELWAYLKLFILRYNEVILSSENYFKQELPVPQSCIYPSLDPLTPKNKEISDKLISKTLSKFKIPTDKPIISQISRFDKWKGTESVIEVYELVKRKVDCRLVLLGSMATDDPEGPMLYEKLTRRVMDNKDLILIAVENQILVNALQRVSSVILQKSLKEGFGLTVSESLWKGTPVVGSCVGGIPLQIIDGKNGYLVDPKNTEEWVDRVTEILRKPKLRSKMGDFGREWVKKNFLITRQLLDYINLLQRVINI